MAVAGLYREGIEGLLLLAEAEGGDDLDLPALADGELPGVLAIPVGMMAVSRNKLHRRPDGPITLKTKRFIVEMYERFSNKRLLE